MSDTKELTIGQYMSQEAVSGSIRQVLAEKTPQFIASITSLVNTNPALAEADKKSILSACLTAASLDLPINQSLGFAYVIAYKDKTGRSVAQFQLGYKGFIQLAQRSGQFQTLNVTDVREGEIKSKNHLTGEITFDFFEEGRDDKKIIGYVAYMRLKNGFEKTLYMTNEELKKHGVKFSKTFARGYGLWKDEFDTMAKKTVLKLLLARYAPMTTDMQKAQLSDQAVIEDDQYHYPDNERPTVDDVNQEKEDKRVLAHIEAAKTLEELAQVGDCLSPNTEKAYQDKMLAMEAK